MPHSHSFLDRRSDRVDPAHAPDCVIAAPPSMLDLQSRRVLVVDPQDEMAISCMLHWRVRNMDVIRVNDSKDVERESHRQQPIALAVVFSDGEDGTDIQNQLRYWRSLVGRDCYCFLLMDQASPRAKMFAASLGFARVFDGLSALQDAARHIDAWALLQREASRILLVGAPDSMAPVRDAWQEFGVHLSAALDTGEAWALMESGSFDGVVISNSIAQRYSEFVEALGTYFGKALFWVFDGDPIPFRPHYLPASASYFLRAVPQLCLERSSMERANKNLQVRRYENILSEERGELDPDTGIFTLRGLLPRAAAYIRSCPANALFLAYYLRLEGLEARLQLEGIEDRRLIKQAVAATLLARLDRGDWLGTLGDQNYVIVMQTSRERSARVFGDVLSNMPLDAGVTLRLGVAPVMQAELERAFREAALGLRMDMASENDVRPPHAVARTFKSEAKTDLDWARRIRFAIQEKRMFLVFQPIVSIHSDRAHYFEILLRMQEGERVVESGDFVVSARETGLVRYLDRWVLVETLKMLKRQSEKANPYGVFVKVSSESVLDAEFLPWMDRVLKAADLPLGACTFEIEEELFFSHAAEGKVFVEEMRGRGLDVCISQFGQNDASIHLLNYCQPAFVKLHRRYGERIGFDGSLREHLALLVEIAKEVGCQLVIGHLESAQALYRASQSGAPLLQGNIMHAPSRSLDFDYSIIMQE
ncbi:probably signal protein [gamma proteobacterium HdN1]|nr:probably signal protein [gamma proteobacterium HdN1]